MSVWTDVGGLGESSVCRIVRLGWIGKSGRSGME